MTSSNDCQDARPILQLSPSPSRSQRANPSWSYSKNPTSWVVSPPALEGSIMGTNLKIKTAHGSSANTRVSCAGPSGLPHAQVQLEDAILGRRPRAPNAPRRERPVSRWPGPRQFPPRSRTLKTGTSARARGHPTCGCPRDAHPRCKPAA
jgi:hypothetical protein